MKIPYARRPATTGMQAYPQNSRNVVTGGRRAKSGGMTEDSTLLHKELDGNHDMHTAADQAEVIIPVSMPRLPLLTVLALAFVLPLAVATPASAQPPATPPNAPVGDGVPAAATSASTTTTAPPEPAPDGDLPDNNDVNDGTDNTDVGLLQVEIGSDFTRTDGISRSEGTPITFRYGAFEWLELSAGTDGYMWQRAADPASAEGIGNVQVGARVRLFAKPGGPPVLAIAQQVTFPTASTAKGLGTGDHDATLTVLTGHDLPHQAHVDVSYGAGAIGEGAGLGRFVQQTAFISSSLGITKAFTPALTLTWVSRQDATTGRALLLTAESVLTISRRMALDIAAQFGVSSQAPAFELTTGMSFVLGTMDEDDGVHARRHKLRLRIKRRKTPK